MTFYLKYRPQKLDELDSDSVRESLKKTVSSRRIPHALLFSGPKGTGKTSAARILAKIINCESKKPPCNKCEQCKSITRGANIDVVEIDAASHRGIDDVRSLRDAVKLAPSSSKKKVYIIDEAHMLTTEASNALLKTLEEPPDHVIFVLATTNPEKLIGTIRSRATEIIFTLPKIAEIVRSLGKVVKGEKIKIGKEALELIAQAAKGSFRDATKILEQAVIEKVSFDPAKLGSYLLRIKRSEAIDLIDLLIKKDVQGAIKQVEKVAGQGGSMLDYCQEILTGLQTALLVKVGIGEGDLAGFSKNDLVCLLELFSQAAGEIRTNPIEQLPLELAVVKWCEKEKPVRPVRPEPVEPAGESKTKPATQSLPTKLSAITDEVWKSILAQVRPVNTSIEALLRAARPMNFDGKVLTLGVYYRFHKERLEEQVHRRVLEDIVGQVLGNPVRVVCTLTEPVQKPVVEVVTPTPGVLTESEDKDIIKIAEEIFGS
jgi:DNA polymerase-3 subunit gamma/tau